MTPKEYVEKYGYLFPLQIGFGKYTTRRFLRETKHSKVHITPTTHTLVYDDVDGIHGIRYTIWEKNPCF